MNLRPHIGIASMLFLPWSVPIWLVAGLIYKLSPGDDASGDGGLIVAFAPAFIPIWIYDKTLGRILDRLERPGRAAS